MFVLERFNRIKIADGVHFSTIRDERFKTSRIAFVMQTELDKDTVSANAIIPDLLTSSCKEYPTALQLNRKLDMMYGVSLSCSSGKLGETQMLVVSASGLDDRYSPDGEPIYSQMAELLCKAVFEPNVTDGAFDEENFRQEQRQMLDAIDAQFNDKRAYSMKRMLEVMCAGEKFSINKYGTKEQVESLTPESVYRAYIDLINSAKIEIICLCSSPSDDVRRIFEEKFSGIKRKPVSPVTKVICTADSVKEKTDRLDVVQSKLILGFRAGCAEKENTDEEIAAAKLMSAVLGGTAHSKLFNNVREKLSLCYYCVSRYNPDKGLLIIESGVENENIEKAKEAVLAEIEDMKNGIITDEEIMSAKLSISNAYLTSVDSSAGTQGWYVGQLLRNHDRTPKEEAAMITAVTREQIVKAARGLTLDTIYVLTGSESKEDE